MHGRRSLAVVALVSVLLAGCGSKSSDSTGVDPSTRTSSQNSAAPTVATPTVGNASVSDGRGDGGGADLVGASLAFDGAVLTVTYRLVALPNTETMLLALSVAGQNGEQARQLGVKYIDDKPLVFVFDMVRGLQENLDVLPQRDETSVMVAFPASAIRGLGSSFKWRVTSNIDGTDVDACPDAGGNPLSLHNRG